MEVANSQLVAASIRCGSLTLGNIRFFLEMDSALGVHIVSGIVTGGLADVNGIKRGSCLRHIDGVQCLGRSMQWVGARPRARPRTGVPPACRSGVCAAATLTRARRAAHTGAQGDLWGDGGRVRAGDAVPNV